MEAELKHRLGEGTKIIGRLAGVWRDETGMTTDVKVEMLEIIEVPVVVWIRVVGAEYEREEGCKRLRKVLGS